MMDHAKKDPEHPEEKKSSDISPEITIDACSNAPRPEEPDSTVQFEKETAATSGLKSETAEDPNHTVGYQPPPSPPAGEMTVAMAVSDKTQADEKKPTLAPVPDATLDVGPEEQDRTGAWVGAKGATQEAPDGQTAALGGGQEIPRAPSPESKGATPGVRRVAGYEILGELGRGGMGVVYKARQIGLNRIVALKMVLAGGHASMEQLARFRIEAEAVAHLQHPNIVQVYEVGEEDGCPFFSLEFIEGDSLAKKIDGTPQPFKDGARLVQALAEGIYAAHQRGIIHRDLKPANILLTPDGVPKITDFGLAKRFEDKEEGFTRSGAIMGTPSYMAPEQAQGRTRETGPAADIYSLGAILYDLLTGRPPFRGTTLLETLQQVQSLEPVAPARLQPNVPRDLETICLKALEKDPQKRYATAGALAEDLRRYLASEPILARPTPWWERSLKWIRRKPAQASLIGVSALGALSLLILGALWLDSERRAALDNAENQAKLARFADDRAEKQKQLTLLAQKREEEKAAEARKEKILRERAEKNFLRAREAVDYMLSQVGQEQLAYIPQMEKVRRDLLIKALAFYKRFEEEKSQDPAVRWEAGRAQQRLADIYLLLGQPLSAQKAYLSAKKYFSALVQENPKFLEYQKDLAGTLNNLGSLLKDIKQPRKAEEMYRQAMKLRKALADAAPRLADFRRELAESFNNLGIILQNLGKTTDSLEAYTEAGNLLQKLADGKPGEPRYREELARTLSNQGVLLDKMEKYPAAEKCFITARDLLKKLVLENNANPTYHQQLGLALDHLGNLWRDRKPKLAEESYREALKVREELAKKFPNTPAYRDDWAAAWGHLAILLQAMERQKEADLAYKQSLDILAQTAKEFSQLPEYGRKLAAGYTNRGILLLTNNRLKDAEEAFDKARDLFAELASKYRDIPDYQQELAGIHLNLVSLYQSSARNDEAEKANYKVLEILGDLTRRFPLVPEYQKELAGGYLNLGVLLQRTKKIPEAEKAYARAITLFTDLAGRYKDNPAYRHELAVCHNNLGNLLRDRQPKLAEDSWRKAIALFSGLADDFSGQPGYRQELARGFNELGIYLMSAERLPEADKAFQGALTALNDLHQKFSANLAFRRDLAQTQGNFAILLVKTGRNPEAEKSLRRGIGLLEEVEGKSADQPACLGDLVNLYKNLANLMGALKRQPDFDNCLLRIIVLQEKLALIFPKAPVYRYELVQTLNTMAAFLRTREKFAEAWKYLDAAVGHLKAVLKNNGKDSYARQILYITYLNLADVEAGQGDHRRAAKTVAEAQSWAPAKDAHDHRFAALLARCATLAKNDKKLSASLAKELSASYADQAMKLLHRARANGFRDLAFLKNTEEFSSLRPRPDFQMLVRDLEAGTGKGKEKN